MWRFMIAGLAACTGGALGTDKTDETGALDLCDGFAGTPQSSTTSDPYADPCPGGGTTNDLYTYVRITSEGSTTPCQVCAPGAITAEVYVVNLCDVDIEVEAACPVIDYALLQPVGPVLTPDSVCTTSAEPFTFSGDTLWWTETWELTEPGTYHLDVTLDGGLGSEAATFCVQ